jgi:hypothetical protein
MGAEQHRAMRSKRGERQERIIFMGAFSALATAELSDDYDSATSGPVPGAESVSHKTLKGSMAVDPFSVWQNGQGCGLVAVGQQTRQTEAALELS